MAFSESIPQRQNKSSELWIDRLTWTSLYEKITAHQEKCRRVGYHATIIDRRMLYEIYAERMTARLDQWMRTLQSDFYQPLGELVLEGFFTVETLMPEQARTRAFHPMEKGLQWCESYTYAWFRSRFTLPEAAEGHRIVMDLNASGESALFVDGKAFGTYRA